MLYVDDIRRRARVRGHRATWSHLYVDSTQELLAFARAIGLKLARIQRACTPFEHFDITELKRQAAMAGGATPSVVCRRASFSRIDSPRSRPRRRYTNGS